MNIAKLNLNLLIALDALLTEQHVTRAAKKVFVTQAAMSNSLNQLRHVFQDNLFLRKHNRMVPTALALELAPKIKILVNNIDTLINDTRIFDPKTSEREFKIGMSDLAEFYLLPILIEKIMKTAPKVSLSITHINHLTDEAPFINHTMELALGCICDETIQLECETLKKLSGIVVGRKNHPLLKKRLTITDYLKADHIRVIYKSKGRHFTYIDEALACIKKQRKIIASLPHILPVLFMLNKTNLLTSIPNIISKDQAKKLDLAMQPIPVNVPEFPIKMIWSKEREQDSGLIWLRQLIKACANNLDN